MTANYATLQQRQLLDRHQRALEHVNSPFQQRLARWRGQKTHIKAAVTILAYFVVIGICFQSSRADFDDYSSRILSNNTKIAEQGQSATAKTITSTRSATAATVAPTPIQSTASVTTLPATDQPSEASPSQSVQYTATGYAYGQCTWYVSKRRPIPQNWGNARDWLNGSKRAGFTTGKNARPGAIGQTTVGRWGHVVYVEQVQDGKVYVSEMNYVGWNRLSYRWAPESEFSYIY